MSGAPNHPVAELRAALLGRRCSVHRREHDWSFEFGAECSLAVSSPWRLVSPERVLVTDADDGQGFGRPQPVNAARSANEALAEAAVEAVAVAPVTADLTITFAGGLRLDVWAGSSGYEAWQAAFPGPAGERSLIAMGGGTLAIL